MGSIVPADMICQEGGDQTFKEDSGNAYGLP